VTVTPLRDHLRRIKHICQRLKSSDAELNLKIYENSPMVCARNSVHHRHRPLLLAVELPQYPVDGVLLHVHVEQQRRPRHLVLLVAEAQSREALWCAGRDSLLGVRRPHDVRDCESVELPDEVLVRPLRLVVGVLGLHTNQM
jgi:hypothetical protein